MASDFSLRVRIAAIDRYRIASLHYATTSSYHDTVKYGSQKVQGSSFSMFFKSDCMDFVIQRCETDESNAWQMAFLQTPLGDSTSEQSQSIRAVLLKINDAKLHSINSRDHHSYNWQSSYYFQAFFH